MSTPTDAERFRATLSAMLYFNSEGVGAGQELGSGTGKGTGGEDAAPPRHECRPGDRRDFLRRLATFRRGKGGILASLFLLCLMAPQTLTYTLHHTPYTLHPTPCTLHPIPNTLHPRPYALNSEPASSNPTP